MPEKIKDLYKQKLISAVEAAKLVKSGDLVQYSEFVMFPEVLDAALAERVEELQNVHIRGICYVKVPEVVKADPKRQHFILNDYHFGVASRRLHDQGLCDYIPITYHQAPRFINKYIDVDVSFIKVGAMDAKGFFNLGTSNSVTYANMNKSKKIVLEINPAVPYCRGGNQETIHISQVDYLVEAEAKPLLEVPSVKPSEIDRKVGKHVMEQIEDGSCIQLGIGGLPNIVGTMIAESDLKDLGVHTEMLVDSYVDLYQTGKITGAKKNIDKYKMTYTFAMGTNKLYDFLNDNPVCAIYPVSYTNDPRIIALNNKVIAINNAIEVDLFGQVCSESVGTKQKSGTGGQLDFIFGAFASKGGKGLICLSSTYTDKEGKIRSRISPTLARGSIVTVPRSITHYVITEFGTAQLKGKSTWQRAEALIEIAHPDLRDELIKEAKDMNIWTPSNKIN